MRSTGPLDVARDSSTEYDMLSSPWQCLSWMQHSSYYINFSAWKVRQNPSMGMKTVDFWWSSLSIAIHFPVSSWSLILHAGLWSDKENTDQTYSMCIVWCRRDFLSSDISWMVYRAKIQQTPNGHLRGFLLNEHWVYEFWAYFAAGRPVFCVLSPISIGGDSFLKKFVLNVLDL